MCSLRSHHIETAADRELNETSMTDDDDDDDVNISEKSTF